MKRYRKYSSPIGNLLLSGDGTVLEQLLLPNRATTFTIPEDWQEDVNGFSEVTRQLDEYFSGTRKTFSLPLNPQGTEFQKSVWTELQNIPYGTTAQYGEIASRINNPKACRAVGLANSRNPIPIIIPCHRIIGKDGSLTGFGGGIELKKKLLELESGQLNA